MPAEQFHWMTPWLFMWDGVELIGVRSIIATKKVVRIKSALVLPFRDSMFLSWPHRRRHIVSAPFHSVNLKPNFNFKWNYILLTVSNMAGAPNHKELIWGNGILTRSLYSILCPYKQRHDLHHSKGSITHWQQAMDSWMLKNVNTEQ